MNAFNSGSLPNPIMPSISVVDFFFPGFTAISTSTQQLLAGDVNSYARLLCSIGALVLLARYACRYAIELVDKHLSSCILPEMKLFLTFEASTIHVSYYSEAFDMLIAWVSVQPFAQNAHLILVSVGARERSFYINHDDHGPQKKSLLFSPWNGSFIFWYNGYPLVFRCFHKDGRKDEISVSCIGRSPAILRQFFCECRSEYLKLSQKKTSVFEPEDKKWRKAKSRDIRPISTVIMDEEQKGAVLKDVEAFLDEKSRTWYATRGIPYRRGFLLYGPPGTGKSSFSLSVAGRFELDIYVLNLSGIDGSRLSSLFAQLPSQCVILLEDVDAAGMTRAEAAEKDQPSNNHSNPPGSLSLSGLLNALDDVSSQEGRVLIMTTNHIEHLDGALIRPGGVDRRVFFHLANRYMSSRLFCTIFKQQGGVHVENPVDDHTVERLAGEFSLKIPEGVFSPAQLLSFLLERKQSPAAAVADSRARMATKALTYPQHEPVGRLSTPLYSVNSFCSPIPNAQSPIEKSSLHVFLKVKIEFSPRLIGEISRMIEIPGKRKMLEVELLSTSEEREPEAVMTSSQGIIQNTEDGAVETGVNCERDQYQLELEDYAVW
ncbi:hypothetical protein ACJ73_00556 [Blastomyces percursus]|uniref:AAA+ ATPase domain-containing protein n=1 Tax=Blastomyces percursus TaxID=1658174 RepID=A0A1J9QIY9_9EURO|nr:hypothetical protein ACJ73_00556 [Blastomyces percursus]